MKRVAVLCIIAWLLGTVAVPTVIAAESPGREERGVDINPIPEPEPEDDEHVGDVIGGYLWNRFRDLADILTIKLGWGTDKSLGFQLRLIRPLQIGMGRFEGYQLAIDRGCVGVMKEAEIEGGISFFYMGFLARKIIWQSDEAKKRNVFFGDVGEKGEITLDAMKMYDDENQGWLTSTVQAQLPYLPKVELTVNWGEIPDFALSLFGISGLRVPPPFHKQDGPDGERIPAPSIFWHGQEKKYETYE